MFHNVSQGDLSVNIITWLWWRLQIYGQLAVIWSGKFAGYFEDWWVVSHGSHDVPDVTVRRIPSRSPADHQPVMTGEFTKVMGDPQSSPNGCWKTPVVNLSINRMTGWYSPTGWKPPWSPDIQPDHFGRSLHGSGILIPWFVVENPWVSNPIPNRQSQWSIYVTESEHVI